ncbi:MAG: hypothetical protein D6800_03275 [Candidatus Zixiibacteriota bacterium]|nr:MAG: hypothetical protein D6800_03275 [candidate division Zixibacteria bacterium]
MRARSDGVFTVAEPTCFGIIESCVGVCFEISSRRPDFDVWRDFAGPFGIAVSANESLSEHSLKIGNHPNPFEAEISFSQLRGEVNRHVQSYLEFLAKEYPEYYDRWASGSDPIFGEFK